MRVVLDTNVLVAAFIAHGACHELFEHVAIHHQIILSTGILDEFHDVLVRKFHFSVAEAQDAGLLLTSRAVLVEPRCLDVPHCRDPKDDMVLGTALAGKCDCVVSGDKDLTCLGQYAGIKILTPADFWREEGNIPTV
jgi:putative PIN family toxin of toxin-antitoxin system